MGNSDIASPFGGAFQAVVVVLVGGLISWEAAARSQGPDSAAELCALGAAVAVLVAGVFFYLYWHIQLDRAVARLVVVSTAYAIQQLTWCLVLIDAPPGAAVRSTAIGVFQALVTVAFGLLLLSGEHLWPRHDPLGIGMTLGLLVVLLRATILAVPIPTASIAACAVVLLAVTAVGIWKDGWVVRARAMTRGGRRGCALAVVLLGAGGLATTTSGSPQWVSMATIVANALGGAIVVGTAAALARSALLDELAAVAVLSRRLKTATTDLQSDQARLHEIRATLAGVTTATELIGRSGISAGRREQLQAMTGSELQRLQRLVGSRTGGTPRPVELDATLWPVVLRFRTEGLPIRWEPSHQTAVARPDDVAEILNVLLSNARRHAGRSPVSIDVTTVGDRVRITVRDRGPGVGHDVRSRLFQWGARDPASPGEGVGLATARLLANESGGSLHLAPTTGHGATFVLELAAAQAPELKEAQ